MILDIILQHHATYFCAICSARDISFSIRIEMRNADMVAGDEHAAAVAWSTAVVREQLLLLEHPPTAAAIPLRSPLTSPSTNLKVEPQNVQLNSYCRCPAVELEDRLTKKGVWVAAPQDSTLSRGRDTSGKTRSHPYSRYESLRFATFGQGSS